MDRRTAKSALLIRLGGRRIEYRFVRRRRRTLGIRVDADGLKVSAPRVALSNARSQWGVCTADGTIRLAWRLVHIEPALADYVVAHESAHLVELNHSPRFYRLLASLYPDWLAARERLEIAGAALPILKETT